MTEISAADAQVQLLAQDIANLHVAISSLRVEKMQLQQEVADLSSQLASYHNASSTTTSESEDANLDRSSHVLTES